MTEPKWTSEPPTEPGWYWCRWRDAKPTMKRVLPWAALNGALVTVAGGGPGQAVEPVSPNYDDLLWSGQLTPPEDT